MANTTKIKTFEFCGSECEYTNGKFIGLKSDTEYIDEIINKFISNNVSELIDIKITTVESLYHNNGGYNNVGLIYTIIYK